ncbi:MAG: DUF5348 domain-containing protein [Oscillospiraceae bacterium]|nr:DUF5348 domain-containing protein [Oscillospiraceae bacterium]
MKITDVTRNLLYLNLKLEAVLRESGYNEYNEFYPDEFKLNRKTVVDNYGYEEEVADLTPDEWMLVNEYEMILNQLDTVSNRLNYLNKAITHEGKLYITNNDRYAVDGRELCCGYRVEYQEYDDEHQSYKWVIDRVEYSDHIGGYYFYRTKQPLKAGQTVRVRW